jgi:SAM-dependent MidA family methyltransferase
VAAGPEEVVADRIRRLGSIRFDEFVAIALYGEGGFFAVGGGAGRREGDFITGPEVGPLFGAVVSRFLDARWEELGRPDPFVVVEAGAGRGALARTVLAAVPRCSPALRYVMVERSDALRRAQAEHLPLAHPFEVLGPVGDEGELPPGRDDGPLLCALEDLPSQPVVGVVVANELLDNLPPRLFERVDDGWAEVRVTRHEGHLVELLVPGDDQSVDLLDALAPDARTGARAPVQDGGAAWLGRALGTVERGSVLVIDYASPTTAALAERPQAEWLRTYRGHDRGAHELTGPGSQDLTCEVALDQLADVRPPDAVRTQAQWLALHGIDELVEEGRRTWHERAATGDLAALRARSRVREAEALLDPAGLGAFTVAEWLLPPSN